MIAGCPGRGGGTAPYGQLRALLLLLAFLLLPWLQWNGQPVLMLDIAHRQLHLPGSQWGPAHAATGLLLALAAVAALCLATGLAGRLWCGKLCPQTVLGQLHARLHHRLPAPLARAAWVLLAVLTGVSFVGYFLPIRQLLLPPFAGWSPWSAFWAAFYGLATWANIGFLRTRVCTQLCPFARLQPWITDRHTPHVQYQAPRGEPRGPRPPELGDIASRGRRLLDPETARDYVVRAANPALAGPLPRFAPNRLGDCTDCGRCVQACPLALDIRHGLDARCLDCGQCLVACNREMAARGYPAGLIRRAAAAGGPLPWHRPRLYASAALLLLALGAAVWLG